MYKIAALILAAGESSRFGSPKQNITFNKKTLLNHIKEHLNLQFVDKIYIVLGAFAEEIIVESGLQAPDYIVFNDWKQGMGSSLSFACEYIFQQKKYDGILITLSDLPLVTRDDYLAMFDLFSCPDDIIATKTDFFMGVPAIFGSLYFKDLLTLQGKTGARYLIKQHKSRVKFYENPNALKDIDSLSDYKKL